MSLVLLTSTDCHLCEGARIAYGRLSLKRLRKQLDRGEVKV